MKKKLAALLLATGAIGVVPLTQVAAPASIRDSPAADWRCAWQQPA